MELSVGLGTDNLPRIYSKLVPLEIVERDKCEFKHLSALLVRSVPFFVQLIN